MHVTAHTEALGMRLGFITSRQLKNTRPALNLLLQLTNPNEAVVSGEREYEEPVQDNLIFPPADFDPSP